VYIEEDITHTHTHTHIYIGFDKNNKTRVRARVCKNDGEISIKSYRVVRRTRGRQVSARMIIADFGIVQAVFSLQISNINDYISVSRVSYNTHQNV